MVYPFNEILPAIKRNELLTHNIMNDSQNNQANWKKPDKKQYILYDSIYIKKIEKAN